MFLKNNARHIGKSVRAHLSVFGRRPGYALRLRLMLWYGGLMLFGMTCFGLLVLILASNTINANVQTAINTETQTALYNIRQLLSKKPSSSLDHLIPNALSTRNTDDITVKVLDAHAVTIYPLDSKGSPGGLDNSLLQKLKQSSGSLWYNVNMDDEQALVEATPIYLPSSSSTSQPDAHGPLIGVLLVAKSLNDTYATLVTLQYFLLLTGIIMLILFLGCGWAVMGYALRPLSELVKTASSITSTLAHGKRVGSLSQRVRRPGGKDEMAQVVDAFNEMLTAIESSTTSQRRFIADASHELRAPLTTIQGNLAFLMRYMEDIPPSERHIMLADAHGETLRLANLVDELLLLARADANIGQSANPTQPAPIVELDRTLLRLVRQMRRRMEIEGATIKIVIGRIEPVRVHGDEESLRRIMVILLDNAIKYTRTEESRDREKITVALERVENQAVLRVSDTGIGIDAEDLPHIFERFYRADLARSREGTGLGLAIAQMLVEQLNGRITAESTLGEGSTFYVWLPLA